MTETDELWVKFFEGLSGDGRVAVLEPMLVEPPSITLLYSWENLRQESWPEPLPEFDPDPAGWACRVVALAARLLGDRLREAETLQALLEEGPDGDEPAVHYSVDLLLAVLPDLWRLGSRRSSDDPLLAVLRDLATRWPLSGIGIPRDSYPEDVLRPLQASGGLWTVFLDRVIADGKSGWLALEDVRCAVSNALGPERRDLPKYRPLIEHANDGADSE